ncbi:hypothetical protein RND81_11G088600 [Saponaria officinalis]|uniref:Shugoshin C-terminal domain-containing protein n=1 Tax=Saponaria officinalis TaxID=3572 RepID=A0AAW1HJR7_SAPOF
MSKSSSFGSNVRKRLSDITNMHSVHKSPTKSHDHLLPVADDFTANNYVQHLLQENAVMIKLVQEKDKIIESNGLVLQKLRIDLHGTQLQNWYLAQSNTQMLAELNMCKDRLRALQHELACKDTLYKAMTLCLEDKAKMQQGKNSMLEGETKSEKNPVDLHKLANDNNMNKDSVTKRGRSLRSQSLGPADSQVAADEEIAENKRRCLRKQSVSLKPETQDDLFEINANAPLTESLSLHPSITVSEDESKSEKASVPQPKQDSDNNEIKVPKTKRARPARSQSLGPSRSQQAVDKEINENKRRCLRRQSAMLKTHETPDDLFELNVTTPFTESSKQPCYSSITQKEGVKKPPAESVHSLPRRASTGRPVRRAAEKIQSYEVPTLKSKMRRP